MTRPEHQKRKYRQLALSMMLAGSLLTASVSAQVSNPVPNQWAKDRGCRTGGVHNINSTDPQWVPVTTEGQVIAEGIVTSSEVSRTDFPALHDSHDFTFEVRLDPAYHGLFSDHTDPEYFENGVRSLLHMEWESLYFPAYFWPVKDDRVWVRGRWIFDCGHGSGGYYTEIHPPTIVASTRLEPHIFSGDQAPSWTHKTYLYIHGQGGYHYEPVAGSDYIIDIPLPPKPSPTAILRTEVLEPPYPWSNGPKPILEPIPGQDKVRLTYPLSKVPESAHNRWNLFERRKEWIAQGGFQSSVNPPLNRPSSQSFGAVVAAGWREPTITKGYRLLQVTFDEVRVNEDLDPARKGEWHMWAHANGRWEKLFHNKSVDSDSRVKVAKSVVVMVLEDQTLTIATYGYEADNDRYFGVKVPAVTESDVAEWGGIDEGEALDKVTFTHNTLDNFGINKDGKPQIALSSKRGDYYVHYTIRELARFPVNTQNTYKQVTVTFLDVKLTDPNRSTQTTKAKFIFQVDSSQPRVHPANAENVSMTLDQRLVLPSAIRAMVTPSALENVRVYVRAIDDEAVQPPPDDFQRQPDDPRRPKGPPRHRALELAILKNYDRLTNFGQGTKTVTTTKDGVTFEVTYQIEVKNFPAPPFYRAR